MTPDTDLPRKPGRPPEPQHHKAVKAAYKLIEEIKAIPDTDRHWINTTMNMQHDILLKDFERAIIAFTTVAMRN